MACSDQINGTDLENAKVDAITIAEVANSRAGGESGGALIDETTTRFLDSVSTLRGQLAKLGYEVPIAYTTGISFTVDDGAKTIDEGGIIYAPRIDDLPLTTTGTWATDSASFYVVQNAAGLSSYIVETYAELDAMPAQATGNVITVTGEGIAGDWVVDDGAHTANVGTIRDFTNAVGTQYLRRLYSGSLNVKWFGASGDGVTDDTASFTDAAAVSNLVLVPYSQNGYSVDGTIVNSSSTFVFEGGPSQLVGTATAEQMKGVFFDYGQIGGVPFSDLLRTSKIGIVAGSIRQNSEARTQWDYISDANHVPIGVSGLSATATGESIVISYDTTYSRVISFVAGPDETLANNIGLSVGSSVGLSSSVLKASAQFSGAFTVEWNGSAWVFLSGTGQEIAPLFTSYSNGSLTISHNYCRGISLNITPWSSGGGILNPYLPVIKSVSNGNLSIQWIDTASGNTVVGAESVRMKAFVTKQNNSGLFLDGTNNADVINGTDIASGNIWFYGIFEK